MYTQAILVQSNLTLATHEWDRDNIWVRLYVKGFKMPSHLNKHNGQSSAWSIFEDSLDDITGMLLED